MINASNEFKKLNIGQDRHDYLEYADITLKDGTVLNLTNEHLWSGGMSIEDAVSSENSFDIGAAIINKCTLTVNNIYDDFSIYEFEDAELVAYIGLELLDGTIEKLRKGTFAVDEPKYNGSIITLECLDNMRKFDKPYSLSKLIYPASLGAIVRDACSVCGVALQTVSFPHNDFVVQTRPTDEAITFREIISWVAQIAGCFCRCDVYGKLELKWYDQAALEDPQVVDWSAENPTGEENAHWLRSHYSAPVTSLDAVVITGVRVIEKNESEESQEQLTTYQSGADGYVISIEDNELIKNGAGQTVAGWLGEQLIGMRFRKATVNHASDPTIEAGDVAVVTDRKGNNYNIVVSSTKFSTGGAQNTVCGAENPARNSSARFSAQTKNYVEWRKALQREKTEREKALEELGERLANSPGVFTTVEKPSSGGNIYYLHNKPNLAESDMIWKMTAEAWGVSTDGGKTWNAGMTVDGDTIVRILNATGVNAGWINAGAITVKDSDGNIIFSVNMDTGQVIISGDSVRIGGKTATKALADNLAEAKDYSDGKLADYANTLSNDLSVLQAQVDGQVEDWYYDYEPSMQNYPASEWTTTEERTKHIGDRFFWKSKGYAYRFMEDNGVWGWTLLQDTDITRAMQAAQNAQDTADGKRRTFVTTPQPPYEIGDLWMTGTDILTCAVPRAQGSTYVSADWQKLNSYTDDTVANEALEEARKSRNLNIILDNEYQGIPADYQGNISVFPDVKTFVQVLYGHDDVSVNCTYSTAKSSGVTGKWDTAKRTYTVTGLTTDTGWVDITASYMNLFSTTKRFNVAKIKNGTPGVNGTNGANGKDGANGTDGRGIKSTAITYQASTSGTITPTGTWVSSPPTVSAGQYLWTKTVITYSDNTDTTSYSVGKMGENGAAGRTYFIEASSNVLKRSKDNAIAPNFIEFKAYYRDGTSANRTPYSGRFVIEETADGNVWTTIYASRTNENTVKHYLYSMLTNAAGNPISTANGSTIGIPRDVVSVRCKLYESGGTTNLMDMQSVAVVLDVDALSAEDVLEILSGGWQGIYSAGGKYYMSAEFIKTGEMLADRIRGGILKLGGVKNESGRLVIVDASGNQIGTWGEEGIQASKGKFKCTIESSEIYGTYIGGSTISTLGSREGRQEGITISASEEKFDADSKLCMYSWPSDLSVDNPYYEKLLEIGTIFERDDYFDPSNKDDIYTPRHCAYIKTFHNGLLVDDLEVTGKKSRVAGTEHYGVRSLYCYEMPTPLFADIGAGRLDETGSCYVEIDDVFSETVNLRLEYFVFLQKEGNGDVWVSEKEMNYFLVRGTPGLAFSWEIKAVQRGYEELRLEDAGSSYYSSDEGAYQDELYLMELNAYEKEIEEVYNE